MSSDRARTGFHDNRAALAGALTLDVLPGFFWLTIRSQKPTGGGTPSPSIITVTTTLEAPVAIVRSPQAFYCASADSHHRKVTTVPPQGAVVTHTAGQDGFTQTVTVQGAPQTVTYYPGEPVIETLIGDTTVGSFSPTRPPTRRYWKRTHSFD